MEEERDFLLLHFFDGVFFFYFLFEIIFFVLGEGVRDVFF